MVVLKETRQSVRLEVWVRSSSKFTRKDIISWSKNTENRLKMPEHNSIREWSLKAMKIIWNFKLWDTSWRIKNFRKIWQKKMSKLKILLNPFLIFRRKSSISSTWRNKLKIKTIQLKILKKLSKLYRKTTANWKICRISEFKMNNKPSELWERILTRSKKSYKIDRPNWWDSSEAKMMPSPKKNTNFISNMKS